MITKTFSNLSSLANLNEAINSGACVLHHKGQDRKPKSTCILLNVTGLSEQSINELAGACVKSVKSARVAQGE